MVHNGYSFENSISGWIGAKFMAGVFQTGNNKQGIISIGVVICFIVSFLPLAGSWYLSLEGRTDLSRLVISAVTVKKNLDKKLPEKKIAQSIDNIFKELKFATGQVKMSTTPEQKLIRLAKIIPEYPVLNRISILNAYQDFFVLIPYKNVFFQTHRLPPELPPPETMFVS